MKKIECPRCTSVFDESGFNPQFDTSDNIELHGDILIVTVGQGPDRVTLQKEDLADERGILTVDPLTLQSQKKEWIFIGGDLRKIGFMAEAMKEGLIAAESIDRYVRGGDIREGRNIDFEPQDIPLRRYYLNEPEVLWIPPEKRMHFQLFEKGFTLAEAIEEAKRCLTCGPCVSCKACVSVGIQESLPTVKINDERCCGCGVCASVCYYSSAQLKEVQGKRRSTTDIFKCKSCGMCVVACPSGARELTGCTMEKRIQEVYASL